MLFGGVFLCWLVGSSFGGGKCRRELDDCHFCSAEDAAAAAAATLFGWSPASDFAYSQTVTSEREIKRKKKVAVAPSGDSRRTQRNSHVFSVSRFSAEAEELSLFGFVLNHQTSFFSSSRRCPSTFSWWPRRWQVGLPFITTTIVFNFGPCIQLQCSATAAAATQADLQDNRARTITNSLLFFKRPPSTSPLTTTTNRSER